MPTRTNRRSPIIGADSKDDFRIARVLLDIGRETNGESVEEDSSAFRTLEELRALVNRDEDKKPPPKLPETPRFLNPEIALSRKELDALSALQLNPRRAVLIKAAQQDSPDDKTRPR